MSEPLYLLIILMLLIGIIAMPIIMYWWAIYGPLPPVDTPDNITRGHPK